jgi:hypothetical protein
MKISQSFLGLPDDLMGRVAQSSEEVPTIQPYIIDRLEVTFRD